ncbi:MAG: ABC transporter permease [Ktedonobacteraceae bacterium]|nr:ABC transporter permease [Ktedonobacteraceae bacterium]
MVSEVHELSENRYDLEEQGEYGWIVAVRILLPLVFFVGFGYEDGLFMTGFRYLSGEPFILLMYGLGYGLEALRVAMVYSMNFSRSEGRKKAYRHQFLFWVVMSLGCGVAQLASALVIQALGADPAVQGSTGLATGAKTILTHLPGLVYLAIGIRVALCAVADWACSGFLHKKKETVEQKVHKIITKGTNLQTVLQAHLNAQAMQDNARHYQEMIQGEREEIKQLRAQQKQLSDLVFRVGMQKFHRKIEVEADPPPLLDSQEEE